MIPRQPSSEKPLHHHQHKSHHHHKAHHSKHHRGDDGQEMAVEVAMAEPSAQESIPDEVGMAPKSLTEEEIDEIADWLTEIGYPQYIDLFIQNNVYGASVAYLKDEHLKEMGITKVGHRVNLLRQAAKFKRAIKNINRNLEVVDEFHEWKILPEGLQCWSRRFKLTSAAIVVTTPRPTRCGVDVDNVDFSAVTDVNQIIGCFFRYIEILTSDSRFPRIHIRLRHGFGKIVFLAVRNLWEEDQHRIGLRHGKEM